MSTFIKAWLCAAGALGLTLPVTGCATLARGTEETFVVETLPSDALVTTSFGGVCRASPCAFPGVSRKARFTVRIERPGYQTQTVQISHRLAGGGAASATSNAVIPVAGLVAAVVDMNTGATRALTPNPLRVTLQPQ
ncbi:MAG: translation initiation factor 2 [Caulobacter sp.]|nr:translation initiation factor 2 [Caulobacter sp.]